MTKWGLILVIGLCETSSMRADSPRSRQELLLLPVRISISMGNTDFNLNYSPSKARDRTSLDNVAILAICCSAGIFATTIHTQDFKDVIGDEAVGRQTLPITQPSFARFTVPVVLTMWSVGLGYTWHLGWNTSLLFLSLASATSIRFFFLRTIEQDKNSFYYWYNVSVFRRPT